MTKKHKFNPRWDEHEKANYCTECGVVEDGHGPFEEEAEKLYYIICTNHSPNGSWDILFWGPESRGYTIRLEDAGRYTKDNMPKLLSGSSFAVPCEEVEAAAHRAVDRDNHLFKFMNKHLPKKANGEKYHYGDIHNG